MSISMEEYEAIVGMCSYPGYTFTVTIDPRGAMYLQGSYMEEDVITGEKEKQVTRRWFLAPDMCKSEIVQTVFKCALTSAEHRTREWFKYRERPVFGPHYDVDALWAICTTDNLDWRGKNELTERQEQSTERKTAGGLVGDRDVPAQTPPLREEIAR